MFEFFLSISTVALVRKKRQASTTSSYTYINVLVNAQFASTPTFADFNAFYETLGAAANGILSSDVKIDLSCPSTVCKVANGTYSL